MVGPMAYVGRELETQARLYGMSRAEARARVFRTLGTLRTTEDALLELRN